MIVARRVPWRWTLYYLWPSLTLMLAVATGVHLLRTYASMTFLQIPFEPVVVLGTALSIFVGFNNNAAYDRWWEARKIWGLMVNYSRAWGRQVTTMIGATGRDDGPLPATDSTPGSPTTGSENSSPEALQARLIDRHIAFVNALRVFLRRSPGHPGERGPEIVVAGNRYADLAEFLSVAEYVEVCAANNPPNYLLQLQGQAIRQALDNGWIDNYLFAQLDRTLIEFNNIQGRSERIKNTPLPRPYTYYSRVLVHLHGVLLPFAIAESLGWLVVPVSFTVSAAFLLLDLIGKRVEDPFENRMDDTPMTALSRTIEANLREQQGREHHPVALERVDGVVF